MRKPKTYTVVCANCGKSFEARRRPGKGRKIGYCGDTCRQQAHRKAKRSRSPLLNGLKWAPPIRTRPLRQPKYTNGGKPEYKCTVCKKVYSGPTYQDLRDPESALCSKECATVHGKTLGDYRIETSVNYRPRQSNGVIAYYCLHEETVYKTYGGVTRPRTKICTRPTDGAMYCAAHLEENTPF